MSKNKKVKKDLEEISAMGAGSVAFSPQSSEDEEKNLRKVVKEIISQSIQRRIIAKQEALLAENTLRGLIRELILESKKDTEKVPHSSTAINLLEELLKLVLPNLETEYKTLTTSKEQRDSFRKHIINAVSTLIETEKVNKEGGLAGEEESLISLDEKDLDEEVGIQVSDTENPADDKFIDIEAPLEPEIEPEDNFGIEGQDATGRALAQDAFNNLEKNVAETYAILHDDQDEKLFEDYLITNLKLYFDKWERELGAVTEPTTDEYEAEKDQNAAGSEAGAEFDAELGDELGGGIPAAGTGEELVQ